MIQASHKANWKSAGVSPGRGQAPDLYKNMPRALSSHTQNTQMIDFGNLEKELDAFALCTGSMHLLYDSIHEQKKLWAEKSWAEDMKT